MIKLEVLITFLLHTPSYKHGDEYIKKEHLLAHVSWYQDHSQKVMELFCQQQFLRSHTLPYNNCMRVL